MNTLRGIVQSVGPCARLLSHNATNPGILVLNAGSSSLKFNLFALEEGAPLRDVMSGAATGLTVTGDVTPTIKIKQNGTTIMSEPISSPTHEASLAVIAEVLRSSASEEIVAVGHRVVHGGALFTNSCVLDGAATASLATLNSLAPLHNPHNLAGILAATNNFSSAVQVGVFDTAYHSTIPEHAYTYALPRELASRYRRYGFHGTSHRYVVERAARFLGKETINAISFHLGNGCSAACIEDSKSIDTSMGYTPLAGLVMGSRSGNIDPSIVLKLVQEEGYSVEEVDHLLHNQSGLYGISGSSDSLTVERGYQEGDPGFTLAFKMFAYKARKYIGAYSAVLNNQVDCVVFTGGIGENSPEVHRLVCEGVHPVQHEGYSREKEVCDVTGDGEARTRVLVVRTNEEKAIAEECLKFC